MDDEEPVRRIVRTADGRIAVLLTRRERQILGVLAAQLAREASGEVDPEGGPDDPGLARLWPDAVRGDPEASAAFRELVSEDLEDVRTARFETLAATIDQATLDDDQAGAWLGVVNDLRLVLGARLDATEETGREPVNERDPDAGHTIVFLWLGWVEEQLVEALAEGLPSELA